MLVAVCLLAACSVREGEPHNAGAAQVPHDTQDAATAGHDGQAYSALPDVVGASVGAPDSATGSPAALAATDAGPGSDPDSGQAMQAAVDGGPVARAIAASAQRSGDPAEGYRLLLSAGYVGCGVPIAIQQLVNLLAAPAAADRLPGRSGSNAELPYTMNAFATKAGVEVVNNNCLLCHAARLNGKLVIGLGQTTGDYTNPSAVVETAAALRGFLGTPAEQRELDKWYERMRTITPFLRTFTLGANPANRVADILFAHRDPVTLAWSKEPSIPLAETDAPPVDVPPWWRVTKKNALYYSGIGRGDQARLMMTTSATCTDTLAEAQEVDDYFHHVRAYIASLVPPTYPQPIDVQRKARGEAVFVRSCARCHGSYGEPESYPNLLIPLSEIGTDPILASGGAYAENSITWFNRSFYGERAALVLEGGYVAPPLDGIWATAPFLHNGSVPTLATLLESTKRPTYWTRSYRDDDLDYVELGFRYQRLESGQASTSDPERKKRIYDTTLPGYTNTGHTYGDALSGEERSDLIEYLKTL